MAQTAAIKQIPFTWEGTDRAGKKVKGKVVSTTEAAVRSELRRQGVVATRVRKQSTLFQNKGKVTAADISIFSRQLATMMSAGIPLVQSFDIIGAGHENPAMQKLILAIKSDVDPDDELYQSGCGAGEPTLVSYFFAQSAAAPAATANGTYAV